LDTIEQGEDFTCMDKDCRNELRDKWLNNKPWRVPKKKKSSVDIKKLSESWQLFKPKVDFATFYKEFKERKEREASESEVLPRIGSCSPN
jgi:hypothetical protein